MTAEAKIGVKSGRFVPCVIARGRLDPAARGTLRLLQAGGAGAFILFASLLLGEIHIALDPIFQSKYPFQPSR